MLLLLSACMISCVKVDPVVEVVPDEEGLPEDVYFILSPPNPYTKVVYTNEFISKFEREDLVGCFAIDRNTMEAMEENDYKPNACYRVAVHSNLETKEDRYFLAPVTVSDNLPRVEDILYLFYYPYNENVQSLDDLKNYTHTVLEDQNNRERYEASDLLWDLCEPDHELNCVYVEMDHAMANIIVEVTPDLIKEGTVPALLNMKRTASEIDLRSPSLSEMIYNTSSSGSVTMWEFGMSVAGNYLFRAVVPANQTIAATSVILQVHDPEDKRHNYRCQKEITLQPGRNYFFNVKKADHSDEIVVPPPVVSDEESWVFDVLDPDTGQPVGLLCKEYVYFQPGHTYSDPDRVTGTVYSSGGQTSVYLSSQAWVLYRYKSEGVPDLNTGYVLRFINDVRYVGEGNTSNYWPEPHYDAQDTGGGLFTPSHGHDWVYDSSNHRGAESAQMRDGFKCLHGGQIIWDGANNRIEWFIPPVNEVSNQVALEHGHVAIGDDGKPFVCYNEIGVESPHKIGVLSPRYLVDRRVKTNRSVDERVYPLVKIGYNQFWMSLALRAATQIDGTPITNYNTNGAPGVSLPSSIPDINAGYIFPSVQLKETETFDGVTYTSYDPYNDWNTPELREEKKISPMYNFLTLEGAGMLPESMFPGGQYYMPDRASVTSMMKYLGWHFGAKLMTRGVRTRTGWSADKSRETEYGALLEGKYTDVSNANRYGANICGFNLRAEGYYYGKRFIEIGTCGGMAIKEGNNNFTFSLPYYLLFDSYTNPQGLLDRTDICKPTYDNPDQHPAVVFTPLRFFLKFNGQDDTGGGFSVSSLSAETRSGASETAPSRDVYLGLEPLE